MLESVKKAFRKKVLNMLTSEEREREAIDKWKEENTWPGGRTIVEQFHGFKYIVEVDHLKIYTEHHGFHGWLLAEEFTEEYCYPARELGDHSMVTMERGIMTGDARIFECNEFGGGDHVFVGTNNKDDAIIIALKYK